MGVALYSWGVMANLVGISFNCEWGVNEFHFSIATSLLHHLLPKMTKICKEADQFVVQCACI